MCRINEIKRADKKQLIKNGICARINNTFQIWFEPLKWYLLIPAIQFEKSQQNKITYSLCFSSLPFQQLPFSALLCYHRNVVMLSWANYRAKHQLQNKISVCRLLNQMVFIARARYTYWFDSHFIFFFFYKTRKCSGVFAGTCHDRRAI